MEATEQHDRQQHGYPHGSPPPPPSSRGGRFLVNLVALVLTALLLVLIVVLVFPAFVNKLPLIFLPLLSILLSDHLRERRVKAMVSDGLYPVQVRTVRPDGRTTRYQQVKALSMPGYILCRRGNSEEDIEISVSDIHEPRKNSLLSTIFFADGPSSTMRVRTTDGSVEIQGRPAHLYALASNAAVAH